MIKQIIAAGLVTITVAPSLTLEIIAFEGLVLALTHYLEQYNEQRP